MVDGLKGLPQAVEVTFPRTQVQTCIVHLLRHSMSFASYKDRKAVAAALKAVYTAVDAEAAEAALAEFVGSDLARQYPAIAPSWRRAWNEVILFLDYPPEVRRLIYTTNAIEALNGLPPFEYIRKIRTAEPERFNVDQNHHTMGPDS